MKTSQKLSIVLQEENVGFNDELQMMTAMKKKQL